MLFSLSSFVFSPLAWSLHVLDGPSRTCKAVVLRCSTIFLLLDYDGCGSCVVWRPWFECYLACSRWAALLLQQLNCGVCVAALLIITFAAALLGADRVRLDAS
uniref:Uncharacterized protein n=1 Tax=Physcomitrium patens TaxID=3218 RepID=A0A2K1JBN1_PHYPA|nr:hypothetical protein PHYPA_019195 [Physcomitrium patens]